MKSARRVRLFVQTGIFLLIGLLIVSAMPACTPPGTESQGPVDCQDNAESDDDELWDAIEFAYTFTFPLVIMDATRKVSTNTEEVSEYCAPINQLLHTRKLITAEVKTVVTPNVDTIYSQSWLDLSEEPLVFFKPDSKERFCSVQLMDMYTNTAAVLGTAGDTQDAMTYLLTGPKFSGSVPEGMTRVEIPTNNAWMLIRTLVLGEEDLPKVYALQDQMRLVPLSAYLTDGFDYFPPKGSFDENNQFNPVEHVLGLLPQEYFSTANTLLASNAPTAADATALETMAKVGVGVGLTFDSAILGADVSERWRDMLTNLPKILFRESLQFQIEMGAWELFGCPIGEFGQEYAYRALIAIDALGANPVSVAIYPKAVSDEQGAELTGTQAYRIHFEADGLPPIGEYGFWSITAYGEDNYLISNELDRYAINDRSNLVYNADGSLDIILSNSKPDDPTLLNNWLPVGEGSFHLHLRIYIPDESALRGTWKAPTIIAG
jgi:hypothetical protein